MIPGDYEHEHSWVLDYDAVIRCSSCGEEDRDVTVDTRTFTNQCKECGDNFIAHDRATFCFRCQRDLGIREIDLVEEDNDNE